MTPIKTDNTTNVLGAPLDWDESAQGPCYGLPIVRHDGVMFSYWRPSWRESLDILRGRPVRLSVVGAGHPPVNLDTKT